MRIMRRADQKLGIGQKLGRLSEVANFNRIHVVDVNSLMNIVSIASQITAEISGNHIIPDRSPLIGVVEFLIQITLKSKRLLAYLSIQLQVLEAIQKCGKRNQLRICSNTHQQIHPHHHDRYTAASP